MDPPPSTQPSETHPNIFRNIDGSSIQVFAEAGHIQNRPQLVRQLKVKHGATICHDPKSAQVILINPESNQGRLFVRDWGNDTDKVVLDSVWVKKCVEAEKALLEDDHYGACLMHDDGLPIEGDDDQESEEELSKPWSKQNPDVPPTSQYGGTDMSTLVQFVQQYANPTIPQAPQAPQPPLMMTPQQAAMLQIFQAGFPFSSAQQNTQADPFLIALKDTIMNMGFYTPQTQLPTSQLTSSPVQQQVLPFPPVPSAGGSMRGFTDSPSAKTKGKERAGSPPTKRRKTSPTTLQETVTKYTKTNGSTMGPPSGKKLFMSATGKEIAFFVQVGGHNRFPLVQSIKKNGGSIVSNINDADYVVLFPGAKPDKTHDNFVRLAQSSGQPAVPARFVNDCLEQDALLDPTPYLFETIAKTIRKKTLSTATRGSPIEPESEDEDEPEPEPEPDLFVTEHISEQERKRRAKCAREAVRRKRLKLEKEAAQGKIASTPTQAPTSKKPSSSQLSTPRKRGRPPKKSLSDEVIIVGPRSPTPPDNQVLWGNGYKFSPEENEYALRYTKLLVERNHEVTMSAVATALTRKMPHHTMQSWRSHIPTLAGKEFDEWKKRAGIAYRKAQNAKQMVSARKASTSTIPDGEEQEVSDVEVEEPPLTAMSAMSASPAINLQNTQVDFGAALEEDLNVIAQFFAEGNDDQTETEDVIWARLTAQTRCKTGLSWEDFYQQHSDEVQTRYQRLVDAQQ
ncbi:hypothetical protein BDZ97DRAFT_1913867 [Flammula alnicola]|nr:hypothetical protein BDZ97DRAFT_1913867 [Flammula alnicola]